MTETGAPGHKPAEVDARSSRRRLLAIGGVLVVVDQLTKWWATTALADGPIDVVWTLRFREIGNTGAAWSIGKDLGPFLGILILIIIIAMYFFRSRIDSGRPFVAYSVIFGGAIGNVLDRLFRGEGWLRGAVVDFIDFQWYPVFNVADMSVVVGSLSLIALTWRSGSEDDTVETGPEAASQQADQPT
ncbi:MAG: signal peptidase II [Actinobacteria bacterium]|nr:signal peptidase II [Actinomycetota bacterium]